jgi:parallel beta-helix repeat protein
MASSSRVCALYVTLMLALAVSFASAATVIHVPAEQPTIQAGINVANNGDTVLVASGTYTENINFLGKAITVKSSGGAKITIIDGGGVAPVVTFSTRETLNSVLSGFTLQNGTSTFNSGYEGGGIVIDSASPTIKNNIIQNNTACSAGGGIALGFASPLIQGNIVKNNSQYVDCSGGTGGGGISVRGACSAQIIGNTIENNSWSSANGGGIALFAASSPLIKNNVIVGNSSGSQGGGISMLNDASGAVIVQNVFSGNNAAGGSGVYWSNPPAALINNTITDGPSSGGSAMQADDFATPVTIANNLIVATTSGTNGLFCLSTDVLHPQTFYTNDIYSANGNAYSGLCTDQTGTNGNISASPKFVSNFRLQGGSPAIDAGSNTARNLPSTDLAGNPRIVNGNGGPIAIVDMGAYEFIPVVLTPHGLTFGVQAVGSTTTKTVTLTNAQDKSLNISSKTAPTGYKVSGCGSIVAAFSSCSLVVTFHPLKTGLFTGTLTVKDNAGSSPQTVKLSGSAH